MSSIHRSFYYMSILASKCRSAKHFHFPPSSGASFKITLWGRKCRKYLTLKVKNLKWICHVHELLSLPFISTKNISLIFPGQLLSFKITWFKKSCKVRVDMTWILNLWSFLTCNCNLIVVHAVTNLNFEYMHNFYCFKIDLIMSLKKRNNRDEEN